MRAALYDRYGPPSVLRVGDGEIPVPGPGEVRVRVHGSSVNNVDLMLRSGAARLISGRRFPRGVGLDFAGVVDAAGPASGFQPGDRVWGAVARPFRGQIGSAAEYVVAPVGSVAPAPRDLDLTAASGLVGVGTTALTAFHDHARLTAGQSVLIRGAAGGFGTAAVQLASALGARVTALAGAAHLDEVRALGAAEAFDYRTTTPADLGRFDVVVDAAGSRLTAYRRLADRTVTIAAGSAGALSAVVTSAVHGSRRIRTFSGTPTAGLLRALTRHVEAGDLRPVVAGTYPLEGIAEAHRRMEAGGALGKWIVAMR